MDHGRVKPADGSEAWMENGRVNPAQTGVQKSPLREGGSGLTKTVKLQCSPWNDQLRITMTKYSLHSLEYRNERSHRAPQLSATTGHCAISWPFLSATTLATTHDVNRFGLFLFRLVVNGCSPCGGLVATTAVPRLLVEHRALGAGALRARRPRTSRCRARSTRGRRKHLALANVDPAEADWSSPPNARQRSDSACVATRATKHLESMSLACNNELAPVT